MEAETLNRPRRPLIVFARKRWVQITAGALALFGLACVIAFSVTYSKYERIVDERIGRPIFNEPAQIFAAAGRVSAGDTISMQEIIAGLRDTGYAAGADGVPSKVGIYSQHGPKIQIKPGPESYQPGVEAAITLGDSKVTAITGPKGESLPFYDLEPQLVTGLFDAKRRSKRRLLTFAETPAVVRNAIVSVEDRRFFEHNGINYVRLIEGILTPIFKGHRMQGGSTLTMQMARGLFLSDERRAGRKLAEMMIALILERRFTKEQILEIYVNQVDLGQRGSFNIRGFGEGALAYFGKDIHDLSLPEAALLAGVVNGPSYFSPFRHPERAVQRRNIVLHAMYENHIIDQSTSVAAQAMPLKLDMSNRQGEEAPYYVDMVRERLLTQYEEAELNSNALRVYTSLDLQLQKAATEAIADQMPKIDAVVIGQRTHRIRHGKGKGATVSTEVTPGPMPQVAMVVLDPHTGEVLALAGGRDYAASQLNHALAKRPTGSIFKPFVYAAAIATALNGDPAKAITQTTMLDASLGSFDDNGTPWSPRNFDSAESVGEVTTRFALAHSINTATVRLALQVGLDKVAALAKSAGITDVKPTPSMAIGTYSATPVDMASAYTVFSNGGVRMPAKMIRLVRGKAEETRDGVEESLTKNSNVMDPRVAFVLTDMLGEVLNSGTAVAVRKTFSAPAAGKTGSSHDSWFAGYTSNLLCVVWIGNDDYSNINIEGAKAAAPVWADFMVRAQKLSRYRDMKPFTPPTGVVQVHLDKASNLPADESCPDDYDAFFVDGTIPAATCGHPEGPSRNLFEKMFGIGKHPEVVLPPVLESTQPTANAPQQPANVLPQPPPANPDEKQKKKGFWHKLFGKKDQDK